ncbi:hypothetical protein Emtol_3994 [Emticicia oligotrophica DSM 17448]|uniref:VWA domain-containing protein n=1 Tax=Emticicia oligotrophica (strain DSM 17448 / CIP 109782 / MTCC 6937 / GPTSA100-15) TaxID=929562 RepID=A0ABM5N6K1_EMTOG|nr:hypothetical protein [Emticicia oligotrophica]AFK05119.1 hypothetical protein Emtol_3994 [Emticicia oligotrophica DSM 17448]
MQDEQNFHRFIKDKLEEYVPEKSPDDWKKMSRKLFIRKTLRFLYPTFGLLIFSLVYVLVSETPIVEFYMNSKPISLEIIPSEDTKTISKSTEKKSQNTKSNIEETKDESIAELKGSPVFPELYNETKEFDETAETEIKLSKITNKRLLFQNNYANDLAEREIRFMSASAVSMSDKISRVRELGKTYEQTSYDALDRNIDKWKNIVIVCDITSSMFPYTTQVFDWMNENAENTSIKGIVFFTDCDSLGRQTRGRLPGKMFTVRSKDELVLWDTMFAAINNTENNKDKPENNIEALLYAQKNFPDVDEIVMIADNSSEVKDMKLLSKVKKKVHIILCGETYRKNLAFQEDYIDIAKKTNGTIHTLEDDIDNITKMKDMSVVRVGNIYFRFQKGKFYTTKFLTRPKKN